MPRTRDVIEEISEVRKRRRFGSAMAELPSRLFALERAFAEHDPSGGEITRYFPVALVACIEGFFRLAIKELVDAGEPYVTNAEKAASGIRIDFSIVRAIHGKAVSIGELIAHSVSMSRLEHIDAVMTGLIGASFLTKMRSVTDRWAHEVRGEAVTPMLRNPDEVFASVARAFELRHIICHELATNYAVSHDEVANCFHGCVAFLRAADELISETLQPGAPLTQPEINAAASQELCEARKELNIAVESVRARLSDDDLAAFDGAQSLWDQYCKAWAEFDARQVLGGTMWPGYLFSVEAGLVRTRTSELRGYRRMEDAEGSET